MSALAVLSGTGMVMITFSANSFELNVLFTFTFTCRVEKGTTKPQKLERLNGLGASAEEEQATPYKHGIRSELS